MQRQFVSSSDLRSVGYDPQQQLLEIEFNSGGIYHYSGVPTSVYSALMSAGSKGQYFHRFIKDVYAYRRVR
jgi:hypothetical protein